jgi:hypothetical protein
VFDLQGSPSVGSRELFHALQQPPTKIVLLGPFPSHVAVAVAQTARWWNLIQVRNSLFIFIYYITFYTLVLFGAEETFPEPTRNLSQD